MSQLTLFSQEETLPKEILQPATKLAYCDVFVGSFLDEKTQRIRVKPLPDQPHSQLLVRSAHKARNLYPVGTIFKIDLYLAQGKKGKKFFIARAGKPLQRAIEYFEHNISLQKSPSQEWV